MRKEYLLALVAVVFLSSSISIPAKAQSNPHQYIMDSLNPFASREIKKRRYKALKEKLGAEAVTIDMWWGIVEPEEGKFNWNIYRENFQLAKEAGLKIIPIMSYHSVNEGNAIFPAPGWIWNKGRDMKFKDSGGNEDGDFISYFAPEGHTLRKNVLRSFKDNFHDFDPEIPKIYLSLGPYGEARYPSFSKDWQYPGVGRHQAGSDRAKISFQQFGKEKYKFIKNLNDTWNEKAESFESIDTPNDGLRFFKDGVHTPYGHDFLEWSQGVMETSVDRDMQDANEVLKSGHIRFHGALDGKMAGIYWLATDKVFPHGAERAAGYNDYRSIIKVFKKNNFGLTYTCFEMENKDYYPDFSRAKDQVDEVAKIALEEGVEFSGENADHFDLRYRSRESIERAYKIIKDKFEHNNISAFSFLRADDLIDDDGNLKPEGELYKQNMEPIKALSEREMELASQNPTIAECTQRLGELGHLSTPLSP